MNALRVDFVTGAVAYRLRSGGGKSQPIARALGFRAGQYMNVVDATAGLGRDSFLFASLGANVTMIERSAQMYALLRAGMDEARAAGPEFADIINRMTLLHGDAMQLLPGLSPDVIFVDPMHPPRRSSALVKLELRQVREIVGFDEDAADLMRVALAHAKKRVVLKWPRKGDAMAGIPAPSHQILGKSTRYDVFITKLRPGV